MGASSEDFSFVVGDVLEEVRENQPDRRTRRPDQQGRSEYF
jgi:hypothetical protein